VTGSTAHPIFRKVDEHEVHQGHLVRLTTTTFEGPDGDRFERDVVHTRNAVAIVPVDRGSDGRWEVVLVRQYRAAVERDLVEIPAGMCDVDDEDVETTARRELVEEAGYTCDEVSHLVDVHPAPGFTTHCCTVLLGIGLTAVPRRADGIEEQHMTIERVTLDDALAMVDSGEITDGKTVAGLLTARARLA
jgi:8-oxo-dGTP pyrophosphatase MutT (NUDIX family)